MANAAQSPEDVVNLALTRLGYKLRVGSLFEGSAAAKKALDIYSQTRDATLRESDWDFAQRIVVAGAASQGAPQPWGYAFTYPADCIRLRSIMPQSYAFGTDQSNPRRYLYTVGYSTVDGRVVWTNFPTPMFIYTAQVTNPASWDTLFAEAVAAAISRRLAPLLADLEREKIALQDEQAAAQLAESIVG
jgi:hypothetical protein